MAQERTEQIVGNCHWIARGRERYGCQGDVDVRVDKPGDQETPGQVMLKKVWAWKRRRPRATCHDPPTFDVDSCILYRRPKAVDHGRAGQSQTASLH